MCLRIIIPKETVCPVVYTYHWHLVLALYSVIGKTDLKAVVVNFEFLYSIFLFEI